MVEQIEKKRTRAREYYHRHKDKILKQKKEYFSRPEVKERMKKYLKEYYHSKAKKDFEARIN